LKLCFVALSGQKVNLLENPTGVTVGESTRTGNRACALSVVMSDIRRDTRR
jgi:hypothetical protein